MSESLRNDDLSGFEHETDDAPPAPGPTDCQAEENLDVLPPRRHPIRVVKNGQYLGTLLG